MARAVHLRGYRPRRAGGGSPAGARSPTLVAMSVTLDDPPRQRPGSPTRWLAVVVAALAAVAVTSLLYKVVNRPVDAGSAADRAPVVDTLREQLAARVAAILEASTPTEHTAHGHDLGDRPGQLLCTAEVYGYEPEGAASSAEVRRVVGYHLCVIAIPDTVWDIAPKLVGPLSVELMVQPPAVLVAEGGLGYQDRVRQVVGDRYFDRALKGFSDGRPGELRKRFESAT
jgi:hypothetical protein